VGAGNDGTGPAGAADPVGRLRRGAMRAKDGGQGLADTVPVYAQISHHSARLVGESTIGFFTDARKFLRAELATDIFYDIDGPTIHYDVYNIEAEAIGARLLWREGQIPAVDPRAPLLGDVDSWESLPAVKAGAAGRMPYVLEMNARLRDIGLAPKVRFTGLFTLAANLVGLEQLLLSIVSRPHSVHRLMRFLTHEVVAPWIVCQRERCGSRETATGSDALASPPLISVAMVREFCLKYVQELEELVGGVRLAGLWGESAIAEPKELLDVKLAGSPGSIQVLDPDVTLLGPSLFRGYADRTGASLVMGLDATLVGRGSETDVASRATRFIEEAGLRGRFVLFINDIPFDAPVENVRAVVRAARCWEADRTRGCYVRSRQPGPEALGMTIEDALRAVAPLVR
jgi:uroporphyrinogen-III decarboxylase